MEFVYSEIFKRVIIPLLIFFARILDVSMRTMRVIFVSRGIKKIAPILGFFEVLIWLIAIQNIMKNLDNVFYYLTYAAGFAAGTYIGMKIEEKLSIGKVIIRIITRKNTNDLVKELTEENKRVTVVDGQGPNGKVHVIYTIIDRHDIEEVVSTIKHFNPKAFYSIEDIRYANMAGKRFGFFRKSK